MNTLIFSVLLTFYHAIYISVFEIELSPKHINAELKVFCDDLADDIRADSGDIIPRDGVYTKEHLPLIQSYLSKYLYLEKDGEILAFEIESHSKENESVWFKLVINESASGQLKLYNSLLVETFPTQSNIIKIKTGEGQKMARLNGAKRTYILK